MRRERSRPRSRLSPGNCTVLLERFLSSCPPLLPSDIDGKEAAVCSELGSDIRVRQRRGFNGLCVPTALRFASVLATYCRREAFFIIGPCFLGRRIRSLVRRRRLASLSYLLNRRRHHSGRCVPRAALTPRSRCYQCNPCTSALCADGSGNPPDMCISAITTTPAHPPPKNAATTHQRETIASPPSCMPWWLPGTIACAADPWGAESEHSCRHLPGARALTRGNGASMYPDPGERAHRERLCAPLHLLSVV